MSGRDINAFERTLGHRGPCLAAARSATLSISGLLAAFPAYAHGEQILYMVTIDAFLFLAALAIVSVLKCPGWVRALLIVLYAGTVCFLYMLPFDLMRPPELNGPFHWALPFIVGGVAYAAYVKIMDRIRA